MPLHERVVDLLHCALLERAFQRAVGDLAFRDHHQPRGVGVQAVHDALPFGGTTGRDRDPCGQQPVHHGRPRPADRGVGDHARGLVHHDNVGVLVHDAHPRHRLGTRRRGVRGRGQGDVQPRPGVHPVGLRCWRTIDQHIAFSDQLGCTGPRQAEEAGDCRIEPIAFQPVRYRHAPVITHASSPRVAPRLSSVSRVPSMLIPRKANSTARTPPHTIAESAMLNTGQ